MSTHTPGPWHVDEVTTPNGKAYEVNAVTEHLDDDGEPQMVNVAEACEFTDDQDIANAALIAAAPDLLAACGLWDEYHRLDHRNVNQVADFMVKIGSTDDAPMKVRLLEITRAAIAKAKP